MNQSPSSRWLFVRERLVELAFFGLVLGSITYLITQGVFFIAAFIISAAYFLIFVGLWVRRLRRLSAT